MSYVKPQDVVSPQERWKLSRVLYDGGEGEWSAATGSWKNDETGEGKVLAIRWNGEGENAIGHPQSSGHAVWFIVPDKLACVLRVVIKVIALLSKRLK